MKILLIHHHEKASNKKGVYEKNFGAFMPLGLGYLGAVLRDNDFKVELLDSYALNMTVKQTKQVIKQSKADIVGINAMTPTLPGAYEVAKITREVLLDSLIVIGGSHMATYPKETLTHPFLDIGVIGEGELTLLEIANKYNNGEPLTDIPGTVVKTEEEIRINPRRDFIDNLDELPFPARDLLPNDIYRSIDGTRPITSMMTSRGCPFRCAYCHKGIWGNKLRFRSAENVLEEFKECKEKFGIKEVYVYDDTFTVNKKRVMEICRKIIEEKIDIKWDINTRVDVVDREIIQALYDAGCRKIRFGVESGSQEILDAMKKGTNIGQIRKVFRICKEVGIETHAYYMIGYPGETKRMIEKTIDFAIELDSDWATFTITTAYPATELFDFAKEDSRIDENYWKEYTLGHMGKRYPIFINEELTEEVLRHYIKTANRKFYLRTSTVIKALKRIKSFSMITDYMRIGVNEVYRNLLT